MEKPPRPNLVLITNHFPFGLGESFIAAEIPFLTQAFDKVVVVARDASSPLTRPTGGRYAIHRVDPRSNLREKLIVAGSYLRHLPRILKFVLAEIIAVRQRAGKFPFRWMRRMMHDLSKALATAWHIEQIIRQEKLEGHVVLYSYWLTSSALATLFVKYSGGVRRIARAHGGDIYEFRHRNNYLSFRTVITDGLDRVFVISDDGRRYLEKITKKKRFTVARIGTAPPRRMPPRVNRRPFLIVSCSFLLGVKQVDRIIAALALVHSIQVRWIHIGDGPLRADLENMAEQTLSGRGNITWCFTGSLTSAELSQFYETHYVHLFINSSASEGIPVTIMEAQSYSTPVVAPAVGGIPEIVGGENGQLLMPDAGPKEIAAAIERILQLPEEQYLALRTNARRNWEERYNAEKNFPTFVAEILKL